MKQVPADYAAQFANDTRELLFVPPHQIPDHLGLVIRMLVQVNRPPFNPDGYLHWSLEYLLKLKEPWLTKAFNLPERAFLHLDRASRRSNEAALISRGIRNMAELTPEWLLSSLKFEPSTLIRTVRSVGSFPWAVRNDLVREWRNYEIHKVDESAPLERLIDVLDREAGAEAGVIPRAVREWAARRRALSPDQQERHRAKIVARLPRARLVALECATMRRLERFADRSAIKGNLKEALLFLQGVEENRSGLARALRAYIAGDRNYVDNHQRTREWVQRHPRVDAARWSAGLTKRVQVDGRTLQLAVEQDPFEVLKLGTYAGTCLAFGGSFQYSAAAVLLDFNKQVVYARDGNGAVVARQLLAISDEDKLVPFIVYPKPGDAVQQAFKQYDREFARSLGLQIVGPQEAYRISTVLARDFWDDVAWDDVANPEKRSSPKTR